MLRKINQPAIWLGLGLVVILAIVAYVVTTGSGDKTTLAAAEESSTGPDVTEKSPIPAGVEKSPTPVGVDKSAQPPCLLAYLPGDALSRSDTLRFTKLYGLIGKTAQRETGRPNDFIGKTFCINLHLLLKILNRFQARFCLPV